MLQEAMGALKDRLEEVFPQQVSLFDYTPLGTTVQYIVLLPAGSTEVAVQEYGGASYMQIWSIRAELFTLAEGNYGDTYENIVTGIDKIATQLMKYPHLGLGSASGYVNCRVGAIADPELIATEEAVQGWLRVVVLILVEEDIDIAAVE